MGRWQSLRTNAQRLRELTRREQIFLLEALVMLPLTVVALRVVGFQRYQRWLVRGKVFKTGSSAPDPMVVAKQAARMVDVAARYGLSRATCLPQALTLGWLLRGRGMESQLRIGVRKEAEILKAHAWVEWQGRVLNDWPDVHQRFASFPGAICPAGGGDQL